MNSIDALFRTARQAGRKVFIPFLTAGDPDLPFTAQLLPRLAQAGGDLIEVGFPFSDPIADGPVVQASYTRALERGLKIDQVLETLQRVGPATPAPLVGMVSYTLIHRRGVGQFISQAKAAGLGGAVVPDLPADEADDFAQRAAEEDFKLILLVTPTTPPERARKIVRLCTGFLYCVSIVGITGERDRLPEELRDQLRRLRDMTDLPLCVGFGISRPDHVRGLREFVDGVIVGSALVRRLERAGHEPAEGIVEGICDTVRELSRALNPTP
jgi:tryptophan synthase alpha chain